MDEYRLLLLLHVIGLAYWLGTDLGVFYSSYVVVNEKLAKSARVTAAKILFALDLGPRVCMTMMLPTGIHLSWEKGVFEFDSTVMAMIWALAFAWLAMVLTLYKATQGKGKDRLASVDFWFRIVLALALVVIGALAQFSDVVEMRHWAAIKLILFGGMVGCGLVIRIKLRPFGPAFAKLASGSASDADNATIRRSLVGTRPYVLSIWIGIVLSSAYGLHLI